MTDTKERILQTALRLFAEDGYEAVSVSTIAGELGMTKGALYKHYKNKQDIFDSIVARMEQRDAEQAGDYEVPEGTVDEMEEAYQSTSLKQLLEFSKAQFRYDTGAVPQRNHGKALSAVSGGGTDGLCSGSVCRYGLFRATGESSFFLRADVSFIHGLRRSRSVGERSSACAGGCLPGTEL